MNSRVQLKNTLEVVCKLGGLIKEVRVQEIDPFPMANIQLIFEKGVVLEFEADVCAVDIYTIEDD